MSFSAFGVKTHRVFLIRYLLSFVVNILGPIFVILSALFTGRGRVTCFFAYLWGISLVRSFSLRLVVDEGETSDLPQGALVLSNHQSNLDVPVAQAAFRGRIRMLSKSSLFWIPLFGQAMWMSGVIFVNRKSQQSRQSALRKMKTALREGYSIWMAPEGTRSRISPKLSPFKRGAFQMAWEENISVQPFVVFDAYKAMAPGSLWVQGGQTIHCKKLKLIENPKEKFANPVALLEYVRSEMERTLEHGPRH